MNTNPFSLPLSLDALPLVDAVMKKLTNEGIDAHFAPTIASDIIAVVIKTNKDGITKALQEFQISRCTPTK